MAHPERLLLLTLLLALVAHQSTPVAAFDDFLDDIFSIFFDSESESESEEPIQVNGKHATINVMCDNCTLTINCPNCSSMAMSIIKLIIKLSCTLVLMIVVLLTLWIMLHCAVDHDGGKVPTWNATITHLYEKGSQWQVWNRVKKALTKLSSTNSFNWRLMLDVMVHKEFGAQFNSSSIGQDDGNSTTDGNVSLLDLMLKLNSGQQKVV
uniref:Uncharacterized protein n=1 Tax=Anopheles melas TaxID=34690 RepID=A0A182UFH9_9DIPT